MLGDEKRITVIVADKDKTFTYVFLRVLDFSMDAERDPLAYSFSDTIRVVRHSIKKLSFSMRPLADDTGEFGRVTVRPNDPI